MDRKVWKKLFMKLYFNYEFKNWNEYINIERRNKFYANKVKQQEKEYIRLMTIGKKYNGNYPIKLTIKPHFKDHRQDLDNVRIKGLLDGLVASGTIKNDNLNCITKITYIPIFDDKKGIEIEIEEDL